MSRVRTENQNRCYALSHSSNPVQKHQEGGAGKGHMEGSGSYKSLVTQHLTPPPADHIVDYNKHFFAISEYGRKKGKKG